MSFNANNVDKMLFNAMPVDKMPFNAMPVNKMLFGAMPVDRMPFTAMPVNKMLFGGMPVDKMPFNAMSPSSRFNNFYLYLETAFLPLRNSILEKTVFVVCRRKNTILLPRNIILDYASSGLARLSFSAII